MYLQSSANGVVLRNKPVFIMMMYNGAAHDRSLYKRRKVKYVIRSFFLRFCKIGAANTSSAFYVLITENDAVM